ncbi:MAG: polysaccharide biosynthesis tyrosine autokinase, partial [Planctomycetia bacterium]|nr:polysaccharide biosynthesis tyrosine autokinase [Planctomycetia bacterium]
MEQNPQTFEFTPDKEESAWSALAFAWRRKWLVLLLLIVGLGLGYLYFLRQSPLYQSTAQVLVVEDQPRLPIEGVEMRTSTDEMHVTLMRSQKVIEKAIEVGELDQLASLRGSGNPAATVLARLTVTGGGNTKGAIVQLSYQSPDRDECPQVLQAVVDAYELFLGEMYKNVSAETIDLIKRAKEELETQISTIEAEYRTMLDESPLLMTGEAAHNIHEMRLEQVEQVRSSAVVENSQLRANIESLQAALKRGISREALSLVIGSLKQIDAQAVAQGDAAMGSDQLFPLILEQQMLLESHGPDHPKVKAVDKRIEFMRTHLAKLRAEQPVAESAKNIDYAEIYLESLAEQIRMNDETIAEMTNLFDTEREAAKSLSTYRIKEETFRSEIDRKSRLFDVVLKRLEEISLLKDRGGAEIQMIHPPARAGQIQPNLQSTMLQAGILSLLVGLGLAFVVDAADRRFRSPDEIRNDLGVPVIGHIPVIPGAETKKQRSKRRKKGQAAKDDGLPVELRTVHAPRGRIAEAYRAVRTAIYFSTRGGGHQVIQVTSPTPGDGKSTLAANLAISVANSGKRVLLVDADFRRPRIHKLLQLSSDVGMADVIEDAVEWLDAVQTTTIENLSVIACGKRPKNPSELLTSRRFAELLEAFREKFELVIVDTPPVMAVTDPLNVAPRVDGVLLVLRLSKNARSVA